MNPAVWGLRQFSSYNISVARETVAPGHRDRGTSGIFMRQGVDKRNDIVTQKSFISFIVRNPSNL